MRNIPSTYVPCMSFDPGHCHDGQSGAGHPVEGKDWVPARLKAVMHYRAGLALHVGVHGTGILHYSHGMFAIRRLISQDRSLDPERPGALFNTEHRVVAIPSADGGMACFSLAVQPLGPCSMPRDESLAREFAAVTAGWEPQRNSGSAS